MTPAGLGLMMRNIDIVCAFGWQVGLFGEQPVALSMIGSALICAATIGTALRKFLAAQRQGTTTSKGGGSSSRNSAGGCCASSGDSAGHGGGRWWAWRRRWRTPLADRGDSSAKGWMLELTAPPAAARQLDSAGLSEPQRPQV
eukprot:2618588-Prymnesium_polylepis.1